MKNYNKQSAHDKKVKEYEKINGKEESIKEHKAINGKEEIKIEEISKRNEKDSLEKLQSARVCILGAGGLGSNIAVMLARSCVGTIHIVDFDEVDISNLNRQYYFINDIGKKKTEAIKNIIENINPFVKVETENIKVTQENIGRILKGENIIVEAFDRAETKAMVVNEVLENHPEKIIISGSGMAGIGNGNDMKTRKVSEKLYICGDGYSDYEECRGIMSPRVNICAAHQANTAIRLILGEL